MDAFAGKVIDGLSSLALEEFNLHHDLKENKKRMEETVSAIKAVLLDAEENATRNHQVNHWLKKLKEVLYDADDLLDDFSAEALARKVMIGSKTAKEVRIFFSKSNQLAYGHKMSRKMKEIRKKLDDIARDMNMLLPISRSSRAPAAERDNRQTHSFVREDEVIGRDEEKGRIVSHLLDTNVNHELSIIAVVGIGGLGKTCLAQLVYNDVNVQNYFEPKMWVCVSDQFEIREIGEKMVGCGPNANIQQVQENLRNKIERRRFLLVLDDVWNEKRNLWLDLKSLLMEGGKGSMVIITTRNKGVARTVGAHMHLHLKGLDEEKSWRLFSQLAFDEGIEPNDPQLIAIAKEICEKCIGVPLAIKTMANLLYSRESCDWSFIRNNELLSRDQENNDILDILRLSYDHLSSNLKNCFTYCSLFPKDYEIEKKMLIQLWIAQGFIPSSKCSEDVGHDYFMKLLSRCFFQDVKKDEFGDIESCKMHDLMHDLAISVSNNECIIINEGNIRVIGKRGDSPVILRKDNKEIIGDKVRHLLMYETSGVTWNGLTWFLDQGRKLRTIFLPRCTLVERESLGYCGRMGEWHRRAAGGKYRIGSLPVSSGLKRLRVLHDPCFRYSTIPESIGKLKHLRYLALFNCYDIMKLPRSITSLYNLQTLKLNGFYCLEELPRDINKMVSLRHLELDRCYRLDWMPQALGQLTNLQTMTSFSLNSMKSDSARLSELGGLNNLKGRLSIYNLQQMRDNATEVESAKLLQKLHLQDLELSWCDPAEYYRYNSKEKGRSPDDMLLEVLQPHHSIKSLRIRGFFIKKFPNWIRNLSSLQILSLRELHSVSIPDGIEILSSLQKLKIISCRHLEYLPESIGNLSSLQQLEIHDCNRLASLPESIGNLSSLQRLEISECSLLEKRCKRRKGEDWPKIAHVPDVSIINDEDEDDEYLTDSD